MNNHYPTPNVLLPYQHQALDITSNRRFNPFTFSDSGYRSLYIWGTFDGAMVTLLTGPGPHQMIATYGSWSSATADVGISIGSGAWFAFDVMNVGVNTKLNFSFT